jgi:hypothetical protein
LQYRQWPLHGVPNRDEAGRQRMLVDFAGGIKPWWESVMSNSQKALLSYHKRRTQKLTAENRRLKRELKDAVTATECRAVIRDVSNALWSDDVLLGKAKKKNAPPMGPAWRLCSVKRPASLTAKD